ncbi:MAG: CBM9 family sugar-binding protein [Pseudomonadota bacterium]
MNNWLTALLSIIVAAPGFAAHEPGRSHYQAPFADTAPTIDGIADEAVWSQATWKPLNYNWLGPETSNDDVQARFKVVWTGKRLYVLAEITDDVLIDRYRDPLVQYWDDDCLEIFIDEDFSGGNHQFNHNAFAYHVSLDNRGIDIGTDQQPRDYSHHIESRWRQSGDKVIWEVAIDIYTDDYVDDSDDNTPVALSAGKIMGLMLAYCDNDGSPIRENFIGSEQTPEDRTDSGWIDAGLFGQLELIE